MTSLRIVPLHTCTEETRLRGSELVKRLRRKELEDGVEGALAPGRESSDGAILQQEPANGAEDLLERPPGAVDAFSRGRL